MFHNHKHASALVGGSPSAEMGIRPWPDTLGIAETMLVMRATDTPDVNDTVQSLYHDEQGRFFAPAQDVFAGRWIRMVAKGLSAEVCFEKGNQAVNSARGEAYEAIPFLVIDGLKIRIKPHRMISGTKTAVKPVVFPDSERPHGAVIVFSSERIA